MAVAAIPRHGQDARGTTRSAARRSRNQTGSPQRPQRPQRQNTKHVCLCALRALCGESPLTPQSPRMSMCPAPIPMPLPRTSMNNSRRRNKNLRACNAGRALPALRLCQQRCRQRNVSRPSRPCACAIEVKSSCIVVGSVYIERLARGPSLSPLAAITSIEAITPHALQSHIALLCRFVGLSSVQAQEALRVLPMPSEIQPGEGFLSVDGSFRISLGGYRDAVIQNAAIRLASNLSVKTGLKLDLQPVPEGKAARCAFTAMLGTRISLLPKRMNPIRSKSRRKGRNCMPTAPRGFYGAWRASSNLCGSMGKDSAPQP